MRHNWKPFRLSEFQCTHCGHIIKYKCDLSDVPACLRAKAPRLHRAIAKPLPLAVFPKKK